MIIPIFDPTVKLCPYCQSKSYIICDIGMSKHSQCISCGYGKHRMIEFVDSKPTTVDRLFENPIGCAKLETYSKHVISLSIDNENYDEFIIWLKDNKEDVISCTISCFKDNKIKINDLMLMI